MIRKINSHTNQAIKHVVKLHTIKHRTIHQEYIAQGIRTISTIINAGYTPTTLFIVEDLLADAQKMACDNIIIIVAPSVMEKISTTQSPSGMLAIFPIPQQLSLDHLTPGIILARVTDPGNAGTLIRTAAAMNKKTVIFIESVDAWNPKIVQASAGAIALVTIFNLSWSEMLQHKKNLTLCALTSASGKNPRSVNLDNSLIIIGNEGHGIPYEWIKQCDEQITLPMPGNFESLNAAIAGSIALYLAATH